MNTTINPKMTRKKLFLSIPLVIVAGLLIYCWAIILSTDILATWRHYIGLGLFLILILLYFKSTALTIVGTGVYLLLATFNVLSITAVITTHWVRIGPVQTPPVQLLSFGHFILFAILNFDQMIEIYLDFKEARESRGK